MTGRQRAVAFMGAVLRVQKYAPSGYESCATCGDVGKDEGSRRTAFAVSLDLGILLAQGFEEYSADSRPMMDLAVASAGAPFCRRCAAAIAPLVMATAARQSGVKVCPCVSLYLIPAEAIAPYAFAMGLVLYDEIRRCATCVALGCAPSTRQKERLS